MSRFPCVGAAMLLVAAALPAPAQTADPAAATARYMEGARGNTPLLYAFLREMPKGADLHSHLSGAVYAESFLRWAAEDGLCVGRSSLRIVLACGGDDTIPAARIDAALHDALVDAFSVRNWQPARTSGHDQFFGTFGRFQALPRRTGDMLAEAQERAAAGNVLYLELMQTLDGRASRTLGERAGWRAGFEEMRSALVAAGIESAVGPARARLDSVEARRDTVLGCGTAAAMPGCGVEVRWLYQVARANPPEQVFAQIMMGHLLTRADPRVVGFNLVQPEDHPVAMRDYRLHMAIIGFLGGVYPGVPPTLHAGELAPGLVPPEGLRFHIGEAVRVAGARRIGHGVGVLHEDRPHELLAEMARRGVLVEVNLSSNDVILGVRGRDHPLHAYLLAGVPVAISTDDEGVSRSELTMEYVRAVLDQGLDYAVLRRMSRASLEHAFAEPELRSRLLAELDARFASFEARWGATPVPLLPDLP